MNRYRPELKKSNDENDVNNLVIQMIKVECDDDVVRVEDFEMFEVDDETVCAQMVEFDEYVEV